MTVDALDLFGMMHGGQVHRRRGLAALEEGPSPDEKQSQDERTKLAQSCQNLERPLLVPCAPGGADALRYFVRAKIKSHTRPAPRCNAVALPLLSRVNHTVP